jgi:catechol 2,3-dioxygenase-like lactoylglutathione lyase family enzyme
MIKAIAWHGTRPGRERYEETVRFVRDVLGLAEGLDEPFSFVFDAENGDAYEIFKPGDEEHEFYSAPAIGFIVEDVRAARAVMEARGAEFVGEVHDGTPGETWGSAWSHFKLPDGYVYALVSRPEQFPGGSPRRFRELRVCITVDDLEAAKKLYGEALGLPVVDEWTYPDGFGGILFACCPASIEIFDRRQGEFVDEQEVGRRVPASDVALRFEVDDVETAAGAAEAAGAKRLADARVTAWQHNCLRVEAPGGLQLTLFEMHDEEKRERAAARALLPN